MDLWLECIKIDGLKHSITPGIEYQIIDINPLKGLVRVINDNDKPCWFSERRFKTKREERCIMSQPINFLPIIMNLNVNENVLSAEVKVIDPNIPNIDSMNKFLQVVNPWNLDMQIKRNGCRCTINIVEPNPPKINGVYKSNAEALNIAAMSRNSIDFYNAILTKKTYSMRKIYLVQFAPGGKSYAFYSNNELAVKDMVICDSVTGQDYGIVIGITYELDTIKRAECRRI